MRKPGLRLLCIVLGGSLLTAGASLAQIPDLTGELGARTAEPAEVVVWNRSVVVLRAVIGGITPEERAEGVRRRIEELPLDGVEVRAEPAAIRGLEGIAVRVGNRMLFGLVPEDLDPDSSETLEEVARIAVRQVEEILEARAEARRPGRIARAVAYSGGSLLLLALFVGGVLRLRRLSERLHPPRSIKDVRLYGIDPTPVLSYLGRSTAHLLSLVLVVFALYLFVAIVLSQFPFTRPWGEGLGRFLVVHLFELGKGALGAAPGFLTVALILVAGRLISRVVLSLFDRVEKGQTVLPGLDSDTARATRRISLVLIWIFVLTAAYPYIPGSRTEAFRALSVFVGLMASLGGVGLVNQVMSGLMVVYSRSLRIGDFVRIGDQEGVVREIGTLSTKLQTLAREEVTIPNAVLAGTTVTNFSKLAGEDGAVIRTTVTIGYDAPWRQVHALLELAADRTKGLRKTPKPRVLQRALTDFFVEYQLFANLERVESRIQALSDLHAQIQDAFNEFGVQIMSPHYESQPGQRVFVPREGWNPNPVKEPSNG